MLYKSLLIKITVVYVTICLAGLTGEDRIRFLREMGEGKYDFIYAW